MKEFAAFRRQVEAILFDLDGTLMDTDDQTADRIERMLKRLGIGKPARKARWLVMKGETPVNGLITLMDKIGLDKAVMDFIRWINHGKVQRFRMMEGVDEMLARLKSHYRLAVVTTRSHAEAEAFLKENNLEDHFELIISRSSTWRLKPHPEPVLSASKKLGLPVHRCLMVGDTPPDVFSARKAGALSVGVLCGFGNAEELREAGADAILDHTSLLADFLKEDEMTLPDDIA